MRKRVVLRGIVVLYLVIGLVPVLSLPIGSVRVDGHFSFEAYRELLNSRRQWILMGHSMALSSLVALLTVLVGTPLGLLFGKTDLPFRRVFVALFAAPLLIPSYVVAVAWSDMLGGLLGEEASGWLFSLPGCVAVLFTVYLPIPMVLTMVFLRTIDPALEEAGRLVCGWRCVLKGIVLPLIAPAILLSGMLVFILCFGEVGVPGFLRYDVYAVESFTRFSAFYDARSAVVMAIPLMLAPAILLGVEAFLLRDKTAWMRPDPKIAQSMVAPLGAFRWAFLAAVILLGLATVVLPVTALAVQSSGLAVYREAIDRAGDSLFRGVLYAGAGATLLTVFGFFIGYLIQTRALRSWRLIDTATIFLFALPGAVMGMGLITGWNRSWSDFIYSTPVIIILGYLAKYTALTSRITVARMARIPPSMEEAARIAGASWPRRMGLIVAPLAWRALAAGWITGYVFSLRDTGMTMLVYPPGHDTLVVRIYTLMANGAPELIAALCILMMIISLLPSGMLWAMSGIPRRKAAR